VGRRFQQTGRRRARIALFTARLLFRFESNLYRGRDGVAAYFNALPRWNSPSVQFSDVATEFVNPDLINVAGTASFAVDEAAPVLSVKITWVIAREDGEWKIASHHVSSKVALI
jgi:ketosteroid isomerase-like protein